MKYKTDIFFISLLLGSLLPFYLSAQPVITKSCNALRASDHLVKQQVLYKDPGRAGENVLWDFSRQEAVDEHYELEYYGNPDSLLIGQEHRTLYKYLLRGDTLLSAGFENRTTLIDHHVPELLLVYPMQYGHKHEGYFHGGGDYCNQLFVGVSGKYPPRPMHMEPCCCLRATRCGMCCVPTNRRRLPAGWFPIRSFRMPIPFSAPTV